MKLFGKEFGIAECEYCGKKSMLPKGWTFYHGFIHNEIDVCPECVAAIEKIGAIGEDGTFYVDEVAKKLSDAGYHVQPWLLKEYERSKEYREKRNK